MLYNGSVQPVANFTFHISLCSRWSTIAPYPAAIVNNAHIYSFAV